ncbi:protein of unknown function [Hyphomicrobium sp. 1Nfss2.1]
MNEERTVADSDTPHEIEKIIAARNVADASKATADAEAERQALELEAKVKEAVAAAQEALQEEIKSANRAIKKGGRTEEFRYQPSPELRSGKLLTGNLTLSDGAGVIRDYVITVDARDGKIVVKGHGQTMQQTLTNVLHVKSEDWSKFLSAFYAGNMR